MSSYKSLHIKYIGQAQLKQLIFCSTGTKTAKCVLTCRGPGLYAVDNWPLGLIPARSRNP
jgi:hypothetical protein